MRSLVLPAFDRRSIVIGSPVVVLGVCQLAIRALAPVWGGWSWLPFLLIYILLLSVFIYLGDGRNRMADWLAPSRGHWIWGWLACAIPLGMVLPIFIPNWRLLLSPVILTATLLFLAANPILEELYWRGTLLDATSRWPAWLSVSYSVLGFTLNHLWIGVIAAAGRHPSALAGPLVMGTIWAMTYRATGSLRWPVLGHILVNLFSLSVPVFLSLYLPPGIPNP